MSDLPPRPTERPGAAAADMILVVVFFSAVIETSFWISRGGRGRE